MNNTYLHKLKDIYWKKESVLVNVTQEQLAKIYNDFKANGVDIHDNTDRFEWIKNDYSYHCTTKGNYYYLYTYSYYYNYVKHKNCYVVYTTNSYDETKNTGDIERKGSKAIQLVEKHFKDNSGLSIMKAFGSVEEELKVCVPRQFAFSNYPIMRQQIFNHISSIDGCSQYPSNIVGKLPDAKTAIRKPGTVKPNLEYPFAFYIKSGHSAEYGVYDTHKWSYLPTALRLAAFRESDYDIQRPDLDPELDETILMKASEYELTETYQHFFNIKQSYDHDTPEYEQSKLVINASIGMLHQKSYRSHKQAHLATVAIARSNQKIINLAMKIGVNNIIQICVDGILYIGDKQYGVNTKALGNMYQEFTDCEGCVASLNRYIIMNNGELIKEKHSGMNATKNGSPIVPSDIKDIRECLDWKRIDYLQGVEVNEIKRF